MAKADIMRSILIVEEDITFGMMLKTWFGKKGFEVTSVSNIARAKKHIEVQTPDLRRRTGDVQNVPEPRTALLRQRVLERHDLARRQQENSQCPVLFQRQLGSGQIAQLSADGLPGA